MRFDIRAKSKDAHEIELKKLQTLSRSKVSVIDANPRKSTNPDLIILQKDDLQLEMGQMKPQSAVAGETSEASECEVIAKENNGILMENDDDSDNEDLYEKGEDIATEGKTNTVANLELQESNDTHNQVNENVKVGNEQNTNDE